MTFSTVGGTLAAGLVAGTEYAVTVLSPTKFSVPVTATGASTGTITVQQTYLEDGGVTFYSNNMIIGGVATQGWWIRQYEEAEGVNVMWFGLAGDGVNDDSGPFQNAFNKGYNVYNFPHRDFLIGNIAITRSNVARFDIRI